MFNTFGHQESLNKNYKEIHVTPVKTPGSRRSKTAYGDDSLGKMLATQTEEPEFGFPRSKRQVGQVLAVTSVRGQTGGSWS